MTRTKAIDLTEIEDNAFDYFVDTFRDEFYGYDLQETGDEAVIFYGNLVLCWGNGGKQNRKEQTLEYEWSDTPPWSR